MKKLLSILLVLTMVIGLSSAMGVSAMAEEEAEAEMELETDAKSETESETEGNVTILFTGSIGSAIGGDGLNYAKVATLKEYYGGSNVVLADAGGFEDSALPVMSAVGYDLAAADTGDSGISAISLEDENLSAGAMLERNGLSIAFVGVTAATEEDFETIQNTVDRALENGADYVILLGQIDNTESLAESISGIDVILASGGVTGESSVLFGDAEEESVSEDEFEAETAEEAETEEESEDEAEAETEGEVESIDEGESTGEEEESGGNVVIIVEVGSAFDAVGVVTISQEGISAANVTASDFVEMNLSANEMVAQMEASLAEDTAQTVPEDEVDGDADTAAEENEDSDEFQAADELEAEFPLEDSAVETEELTNNEGEPEPATALEEDDESEAESEPADKSEAELPGEDGATEDEVSTGADDNNTIAEEEPALEDESDIVENETGLEDESNSEEDNASIEDGSEDEEEKEEDQDSPEDETESEAWESEDASTNSDALADTLPEEDTQLEEDTTLPEISAEDGSNGTNDDENGIIYWEKGSSPLVLTSDSVISSISFTTSAGDRVLDAEYYTLSADGKTATIQASVLNSWGNGIYTFYFNEDTENFVKVSISGTAPETIESEKTAAYNAAAENLYSTIGTNADNTMTISLDLGEANYEDVNDTVEVYVDGNFVDSGNYDMEKEDDGRLEITFSLAYLSTLDSEITHTFEVRYTFEETVVTTTFENVVIPNISDDNMTPATGDTNRVALYIVILVVLVAAVIVVIILLVRRRRMDQNDYDDYGEEGNGEENKK